MVVIVYPCEVLYRLRGKEREGDWIKADFHYSEVEEEGVGSAS